MKPVLFVAILAATIASALASSSSSAPKAVWSYTQTPSQSCNAVRDDYVLKYGMPCYNRKERVVVFPHWYVASNGSDVDTMFRAFDIDTGGKLWEFCTATHGEYCEGNVINSSLIFLASSDSIWSVDARAGTTIAQAPLTNNGQPAIPTAGPDGFLFVSNGGPAMAFDNNLVLQYSVGTGVSQHIDAFNSGLFYYNGLNAAGKTSLVAASVRNGATIWQTAGNSDSTVANPSVVTTASYNVNPNIVTAYSSVTGKQLWTTADFSDYDLEDGHFVGVYPVNSSANSPYYATGRDSVTGIRLWSTMVNSSPPTVMGSGMVFLHGHSNMGPLTAIRLFDGTVAWQYSRVGCTAYNGQAFDDLFFVGFAGANCTMPGELALMIRNDV